MMSSVKNFGIEMKNLIEIGIQRMSFCGTGEDATLGINYGGVYFRSFTFGLRLSLHQKAHAKLDKFLRESRRLIS